MIRTLVTLAAFFLTLAVAACAGATWPAMSGRAMRAPTTPRRPVA